MFFFFLPILLAPVCALVAAMLIPKARLHAALLGGWAGLSLFGFALLGLFPAFGFMSQSPLVGSVILAAVLSGFVASIVMFRRLLRLHRGEPLGSARYLIAHHAAVPIAFLVSDLVLQHGFALSGFCLAAGAVGSLIAGYEKSPKAVLRPVAF